MADKPTIVKPLEDVVPIAKPSAFDLDKFKSKRAAAIANVETLQTGLPHHTMSQAKDFVRLHPDEDELLVVRALLRQRADQGTEERHAAPDRRRLGAAIPAERQNSALPLGAREPSPTTCSSSAMCRPEHWTTSGTTTNLAAASRQRRRGCKPPAAATRTSTVTRSTSRASRMPFLTRNGRHSRSTI